MAKFDQNYEKEKKSRQRASTNIRFVTEDYAITLVCNKVTTAAQSVIRRNISELQFQRQFQRSNVIPLSGAWAYYSRRLAICPEDDSDYSYYREEVVNSLAKYPRDLPSGQGQAELSSHELVQYLDKASGIVILKER